jgi:hypothetical protein
MWTLSRDQVPNTTGEEVDAAVKIVSCDGVIGDGLADTRVVTGVMVMVMGNLNLPILNLFDLILVFDGTNVMVTVMVNLNLLIVNLASQSY